MTSLDATIGVEVQLMTIPRPVGYVVIVDGKSVAFLPPEFVETAYRYLQELARKRRAYERKLGL